MLRDGDALLIAGKGHETGQIVGDKTLPFSDADEARAALKEALHDCAVDPSRTERRARRRAEQAA